MFGCGVVILSREVAMLSSGIVTFSHGVISFLVVEWPFLVFCDVTPSQF